MEKTLLTLLLALALASVMVEVVRIYLSYIYPSGGIITTKRFKVHHNEKGFYVRHSKAKLFWLIPIYVKLKFYYVSAYGHITEVMYFDSKAAAVRHCESCYNQLQRDRKRVKLINGTKC